MTCLRLRCVALFFFLTLTATAPGRAACLIDKFEPDGADWIGEDVAISTRFMAFSASASDELFIYRRKPGGGYNRVKLSGFDFITEVEIFQDRVVATGGSNTVKIVNVRDGFSVSTVTVPGATSSALRDDLLVVGSAYVDDPGFANGRVTVFRDVHGTWTEEAVLQNADNKDFDIFGHKVAIHPDGRIFVGAIGAQTNGVRVGAVYVFTDTGGLWLETEKITWVLQELDFYGSDFAIPPDGLTISIAALGREAVFTQDFSGLVVQEHKLLGEPFSEFGASVAANKRYTVVGAPYAGRNDVGEVHLYQYDGIKWFSIGKIESPDGFPVDEFGRSVAIADNNMVLIGAPLHPNEFGPGAVYLYHINDCPP